MEDFFVSHSSLDKVNIVDDLVQNLKDMGYLVWYDKDKILAGDNISEEINNGLRHSYCLLLVLTENFIKSKWTYFEAGQFFVLKNRRIIPLMYNLSQKSKEVVLNLFGNQKYIDIVNNSKEEIVGSLIKALEKTKQDNQEFVVIDSIKKLQHQLSSYETLNANLISLKINEYLEFLEEHKDLDYVFLSAKKIVIAVVCDLLKSFNASIEYEFETEKNGNEWLIKELDQFKIGSINFREYVEFILKNKSQTINFDEINILNLAIKNILIFYINTKYPIKPSSSSIVVVKPEELTYKDFLEMYQIDLKVMRNDLIASSDTCYNWHKYNNFTHIAIKDTTNNKIVGYFSVLPITDDTYKKILSGKFKDNEFTIDCLEQYLFPDFYKLYVAGVGIDPDYQNTGAFIKLYNALLDMFLVLAKEREIYISEVIAEASTRQGEKFCKMVRMKKLVHTTTETDVYGMVLIPPQFRLNTHKGKEFYELCQKKFEECRDFFEQT